MSDNNIWQGVLKHHHGKNFRLYPDTPNLFLLDMADSLAAAISRGDNRLRLGHKQPYKKYGYTYKSFKLWKDIFIEKKIEKVQPLDLKQVFNLLNSEPTFDELLKLVKVDIYDRAEDATRGANLTSLYIHSVLTGKFYRLLKQASYYVSLDSLGHRKYKVQRLYRQKIHDWKFTISRLKIHFPQKPIRTKDMNVFWFLNEARKNIEKDYADNIFFNTSDEIIMVRPPDVQLDILKSYLDCGFWIEYAESKQILQNLNPNLEANKERFKEGVIYKKLPSPRIEPPICEICQKEKATKEWVKDYILSWDMCESCREVIEEQPWPPEADRLCEEDLRGLGKWFDETITEDLCESCLNIRIQYKEKRLRKLEKWSEREWYEKEDENFATQEELTKKAENPKVIWIKVNLDFFELIKSLEFLYSKYLEDIGVPNFDKNVEIRFSVLSEFHRDYHVFLDKLNESLKDIFGDDMEVPILDDFFVIRIDALSQIIDVLHTYHSLFANFFPQFKVLKVLDAV